MTRINYPESWPKSACDQLDAMFEKANKEKLWFFINSMATGPMWFSPTELDAQQKNGKFIWGPLNWQLRNPREYLTHMQEAADEAKTARDQVAERLNAAGILT